MRATRDHLFIVLTLLLSMPAYAATWKFDDVQRVVAMSDVHGAFGPMVRTLENAAVIDDNMHWVGAKTHLIIVGDLLDRGPESRKAMDLLMRLEGEAAAAGGAVHVLIGNHEAMNLMGDLRYVSKEEYAAFAKDETDEERERWFNAYAKRAGGDADAPSRADFAKKYPAGYFAHRRAFSASGTYGKWLLHKPIIVVVNDTAFVHGGLSPMTGKVGLRGVNETLRLDLVNYVRTVALLEDAGVLLPTDSANERLGLLESMAHKINASAGTVAAMQNLETLDRSPLHASDGPLWYRGNVYCGPLIEQDRLQKSLKAIGAERVVIGHTPTPDRQVMQRMAGRVFEVDTGMLGNYYGGIGHALILEGDAVRVVSEASTELLAPEAHPRRVGERPDGELSTEELERLLQHGDIVSAREDDVGRRIVTVSNGQRTIDALFQKRASRGFYPDVAAYRLDRMLDLSMVPVAIVREVDRDDGSLQFLPVDVLDEAQRSESGRGASAYCPLEEQWQAMYLFDALLYNEGRSQQRMLYSLDNWQLMLTGHDRAFATAKGKPRHLERAPITVNSAWRSALQSLDDKGLSAELGDVLDAKRRRALLARRDQLLQER